MRVTQGHHIRHWAAGGPTTLSNLVLLCRRHHRALHEDGYQVTRADDGALHFVRPNGWPFPAVPAPPTVPADPAAELEQSSRERGLDVGPDSLRATDGGRHFDLGWALDVLHPKSNPMSDDTMPTENTSKPDDMLQSDDGRPDDNRR